MRRITVAVLFGGVSSERAISLKTGAAVVAGLNAGRYLAYPIIIEKNGLWRGFGRISAAAPMLEFAKKRGVRAVFIALHGKYGEDGMVQGLLEFMGILYTGSGVLASALAMDKVRSSELFAASGLSVPRFVSISKGERAVWKKFPVVVKPADGGSSVGVSIVHKPRELVRAVQRAFRTTKRVMLQEFIRGDEVTCGVLERNGKPFALPPTQIIPERAAFFDYRAKYVPGASREITPPELPKSIIKRVQEAALHAHRILGCRGISRSDMIVRRGKIYVLETNTIPGMTATSLIPQAAKAAGIGFPELVDDLIAEAL